MKKLLSGLLALALVLSLAGCGISAKFEEKAGEAILKKIAKDAGGDIDIDGDKMVIKGEDGQQFTFGEGEWPKSDLAKSIPEFKGGRVTGVMEADGSLFISLEEAAEKDFADYLAEIKKDFTEDAYHITSDSGTTYGAKNAKDVGVMLMYSTDGAFSITVSQMEE